MNIIKDNYRAKKQSNNTLMLIVIAIIILVVISAVLLVVANNIKNNAFKFYVDNKATTISEKIFKDVDGTRYVNIKTFASAVGYEYNNGEYNNPYEEDKTKCYVKCNNEIASFIADSNKIYKVTLETTTSDEETNQNSTNTAITTDSKTTANTTTVITGTTTTAKSKNGIAETEYFEFQNDVKLIDGEIYASVDAINVGFNTFYKYDSSKNRIDIYTLPYLVEYYKANVDNAILDENCEFSNQKLLLYDMVLVKNSDGDYGVKQISTGEAVLGTKYANIKFIESSKNFVITTDNGKQGIASLTETIISPQYDELSQLDKNLNLYLVRNGEKYGVINGSGDIVIYIEYDQIGMDTSAFINNDINSQYILYEKYIPVKRDGKWGLINFSGATTLPVEYDGLGCVKGDSLTKTDNNVLLISDINGIVVSKGELYGVMSPEGVKLVPISLTEMYKTTNSGVKSYYMTYNAQKINIVEWVKEKQNT